MARGTPPPRCRDAKIVPDKDIPHITAPIIIKYITNLQLLGLL
jgi:fatty acid CoA ligase FadD9